MAPTFLVPGPSSHSAVLVVALLRPRRYPAHVHWHFTSTVLGDARVQLAATMARFMAPRGVDISASTLGALRPEVIASLTEVGLPAPPVDGLQGRPVDVLVVITDDDVSPGQLPHASERHVLKVASPSLDALAATREHLREHLRHLMARRDDRPADPEASPGWIRNVDRQAP